MPNSIANPALVYAVRLNIDPIHNGDVIPNYIKYWSPDDDWFTVDYVSFYRLDDLKNIEEYTKAKEGEQYILSIYVSPKEKYRFDLNETEFQVNNIVQKNVHINTNEKIPGKYVITATQPFKVSSLSQGLNQISNIIVNEPPALGDKDIINTTHTIKEGQASIEKVSYKIKKNNEWIDVDDGTTVKKDEIYRVHLYFYPTMGASFVQRDGLTICGIRLSNGTPLTQDGEETVGWKRCPRFYYDITVKESSPFLQAISSDSSFGSTNYSSRTYVTPGTAVTLVAYPKNGYSLVEWQKKIGTNYKKCATTKKLEIIKSSIEETYRAVFDRYTLKVNSNDTSCGVVSPSSVSYIEAGTTITLQATSQVPGTFVKWQKKNVSGQWVDCGTSEKLEITKDYCNEEYQAVFKRYLLTCYSTLNDYGSVSPAGDYIYYAGQTIKLKATSKNNGTFLRWEKRDGYGDWFNFASTTSIQTAKKACFETFRAVFESYKLDCRSTLNEYGCVSPSGSQVYVAGTKIKLNATCLNNGTFEGWQKKDSKGNWINISSAKTIEITKAYGNEEYQAIFKCYKLSCSSSSANYGKVSPSEKSAYTPGTKIKLKATCLNNGTFEGWRKYDANGKWVDYSKSKQIEIIKGKCDESYQAIFNGYSLRCQQPKNDWFYSVEPSRYAIYEAGTKIRLKVTTHHNTTFCHWLKKKSDGNWEICGTTKKLDVIKDYYNEEYQAVTGTYYLICESSPKKCGTVSYSKGEIVVAGTKITLTATPTKYGTFDHWERRVDNEEKWTPCGNQRKLKIEKSYCDEYYKAVFIESNLCCYSNNSHYGTGRPNYESPVAIGEKTTIRAVPEKDCAFVKWQKSDGNGNNYDCGTSNPLTIKKGEGHERYTAHFNCHILKCLSDNEEYGVVSFTGERTAAPGERVNLAARPKEGYGLAYWELELPLSQKYSVKNAGDTENLTITKGTEYEKYTAIFDKLFTLECTSNNKDLGSVTPSGINKFPARRTITLTATPKNGASFSHWMERLSNGQMRKCNDTRTITFEKKYIDEKFEAVFTAPKTLRCICNNREKGSTSMIGEKKYPTGEKIILTATPKEYYHFIQWWKKGSDGELHEYSTSKTIIITKEDCDELYGAEFKL